MSNTLWYLWPIVALGRLVAVLLGGVLMIAGGLLTMTVVGAVAGIPLMIVGLLLTARGIF